MELIAQILANNCNEAKGPWQILVPMGGFSAFDSDGGPLPDPAARQRFIHKLEHSLKDRSLLTVLPCHVNDPDFAAGITAAVGRVMRLA